MRGVGVGAEDSWGCFYPQEAQASQLVSAVGSSAGEDFGDNLSGMSVRYRCHGAVFTTRSISLVSGMAVSASPFL